MALVPMSAAALASSPTLFTDFMGEAGTRYRTVGELRAIYRERSLALSGGDCSDHLRVDRFAADMAAARWDDDVIMRVGVFDGATLVVDGIHRGIAYLSCIEAGISPERLPALHVDC
jgi:hypothetical protein